MSSLFEIVGLDVSYPGKTVLNDLSLSLDKGELCALLGLNGSGKTSLIRAACGLFRTDGEISVSGQNVMELDERKRARLISYLPQASGIEEGVSVADAVLMGYTSKMGIFDRPSKKHVLSAEKLLERVGMLEYKDRDFSTLSQGEKQLVIFARCLAQGSPVMLMDEPDSSLDFSNRHKVLSVVRNIIKEEGCSALITMHDPNFALLYCDRVFVLSDGKIKYEFKPAEADIKTVKEALMPVYGDIDIIEYSGRFFMGVGGTGK